MRLEQLNQVTHQIIGAAIDVHKELGPGLLESTYEACLEYELRDRGFQVERQKGLPVIYKGVHLDCGYRLDLVVEGIVIELKSVERLAPIHKAQLMTYLKLSGNKLGLLINFNVERLKNGITRMIM